MRFAFILVAHILVLNVMWSPNTHNTSYQVTTLCAKIFYHRLIRETADDVKN